MRRAISARRLPRRGLEPEIVVNNAGFGLLGTAEKLDRAAQLAMIDLNVRALTDLSLAFIDSLARRKGGILNVASTAGFLPGPGMAVYYASKAYVVSFSEALHEELKPRGVRVTVLCPGPVPTEFQARAGMAHDSFPSVSLALRRVGCAPGLPRIEGGPADHRSRLAQQNGACACAVVAAISPAKDHSFPADKADGLKLIRVSNGGCARDEPCHDAPCNGRSLAALSSGARLPPCRNPSLIILHQEMSTPGRVGYALRRRGYQLDTRRPRFGDPLPTSMAEHAGAIIFGGPMSANDTDDFIRREIDWLGVPLREKKPFLGICLGAQMLAQHLGSRVYKHPDGHAEVGYYPIRPTEADCASATPGLSKSTNGIARASICHWAPICWREGDSFPGAGLPLRRHGLRPAISPRCNPRHDVPLDHARPRAHALAQCQAASGAFRGSAGLRSGWSRVVERFSQPLARQIRHR